MHKLDLGKGRVTRDQIANICWIIKKAKESQKNIYFCFTDYTKAFDCVDHNKQQKILKEVGIPDHFTCLLRNLMQVKNRTFRTGHGTTDWLENWERTMSRLYILSPCLFNMPSTRELPGILESRLPGEISAASDMQMTLLLWQKVKRNKRTADESERESEKAGLKLNIQLK